MLSAQCTDERVNKVTPNLFARYKTAEDFAGAKLSELEKLIHSTGFYKNKAKNIIKMAQELLDKHQGEVPGQMENLTSLAGVGRKTANVILSEIFKTPSMVVDTHVTRLGNRLGLIQGTDAVKLEYALMEIVEKKHWSSFSHWLISHGRAVCSARKPVCEKCTLRPYCPQKGLS
jgi:endonuclease-3